MYDIKVINFISFSLPPNAAARSPSALKLAFGEFGIGLPLAFGEFGIRLTLASSITFILSGSQFGIKWPSSCTFSSILISFKYFALRRRQKRMRKNSDGMRKNSDGMRKNSNGRGLKKI